jgi:uncharacterized protein YqeY
MSFAEVVKDHKEALRGGDRLKYKVLTTLIGEVNLEKSRSLDGSDDIFLQRVLKRFINDAKVLHTHKKDDAILQEIEILEAYVPRKMSDESIMKELLENNFDKLPDVMKHFKQFGQTVDMGRVRELFNQM